MTKLCCSNNGICYEEMHFSQDRILSDRFNFLTLVFPLLAKLPRPVMLSFIFCLHFCQSRSRLIPFYTLIKTFCWLLKMSGSIISSRHSDSCYPCLMLPWLGTNSRRIYRKLLCFTSLGLTLSECIKVQSHCSLMPGFATKVSFKMLCPQSCGSLAAFQFLTIKNVSAGKASVILL